MYMSPDIVADSEFLIQNTTQRINNLEPRSSSRQENIETTMEVNKLLTFFYFNKKLK